MIEYKEIDYFGTKIKVSRNGDIIWNDSKRNIYYNADGYSVCTIKLPNIGWRSVRVARLVALAYIPNPDNLPEVNHKDYNRKNSNAKNLEWISRKDNVNYSMCNRPNYNGENNPNFGNKKLSQIYANNKEYAIEKQGRKGLQNGRCRRIKVFENGKFIKEFDYILECCKYIMDRFYHSESSLQNIRTNIDRSVRNNTTYKGLTFIKE